MKMRKKLLSMGTIAMTAAIMLTPVTTTFAAEQDTAVTKISIEDETENVTPSDELINASESIEAPIISNEDAGIEPAWLFEKTYKVTGNNVNIRTGAGTKYSVVGTLYKGDVISVKSIDNGWAKFKYNGQWRYVSATYIKAA